MRDALAFIDGSDRPGGYADRARTVPQALRTHLTRWSMPAVMLLSLLATSCGAGGQTDDPYAAAGIGLCDATAEATAGEGAEAGRVFYDTVHRPLHDLASETTQFDRALAARLLEAKESVEGALDDDPAGLTERFQALVGATDAALGATGHRSLSCSTGAPS